MRIITPGSLDLPAIPDATAEFKLLGKSDRGGIHVLSALEALPFVLSNQSLVVGLLSCLLYT